MRICKEYFKRKRYAIARRLIPAVREQDKLDRLVGPIGYWQQLQDYQLNFIKTKGLRPDHRLLDIGCGPLQGGLAFIQYLNPNNYVGVDIRQSPLKEAYALIAKYNLSDKNPRLILSDSFGLHELNGLQFDYAWSCQMLYHLEPETIHHYFECIGSHLKPGAFLYADIIGYPNKVNEDSHWSGYKFYLHTFEFLEQISRQHGLSMKRIGQIGEYGYPKEIALHTNEMLQFQKTADCTVRTWGRRLK